jgi:hypothetical protein
MAAGRIPEGDPISFVDPDSHAVESITDLLKIHAVDYKRLTIDLQRDPQIPVTEKSV